VSDPKSDPARILKPIVALYGAFDRFNFGDLLFPVICRHFAPPEMQEQMEWRHFGLVDNDLRHKGGAKVDPIGMLLRRDPMPPGSMVIIAGGEVLTASASTLYGFLRDDLDKVSRSLAARIVRRIMGTQNRDQRAMRRLAVPWAFPLVPSRRDIPGSPPLAFLCAGGQGLSKLQPKQAGKIISNLRGASFVSVRDQDTHSTLLRAGIQDCVLTPDSVHAIRKLYSVDEITARSSQATQLTIRTHKPQGYFCFQSALRHLSKDPDRVAAQLDKLSDKSGLVPVLVAAGTALGHEDDTGLQAVSSKMQKPHAFVPIAQAAGIVALLANARLAISTSLHATIIASAYAIPRLPLTGLEQKTATYVKTWDPDGYIEGVDYSNMVELAICALHRSPTDLMTVAESLAAKAEENLRKMWQTMSCEREPHSLA
jgi:hypothetical protein